MPRRNRVRSLCWIRRDLRLADHAALAKATEISGEVVVVFVFDKTILGALADKADRRVTFIRESLVDVDEQLSRHGSRLIVRIGDPVAEIPKLALELNASKVVAAIDTDPYARARDSKVAESLKGIGREFVPVDDVTVFKSGEVLNQSGAPFKVYTPYSKAWRALMTPRVHLADHRPIYSHLAAARDLELFVQPWQYEDIGFTRSDPWLKPGELEAHKRLDAFMKKIDQYGAKRDFPAAEATSALSTDLRFGTLSIRECMRRSLEHPSAGSEKWFSELIWREFYHDVLGNFPEVVRTTFDPAFAKTEWPGSRAHFEAWCQGMTGYPIVDASMRHFNQTGWMHNRNRMIVASFLTKHLLCDWRWGEAYFAAGLLDFDLAQNNGGWQWAASTGVDAQPYFRIFNPYLQSKKFDPGGAFIRSAIPELGELDSTVIHEPSRFDLDAIGAHDYPSPIVDHSQARERAMSFLSQYKKLVPGNDA